MYMVSLVGGARKGGEVRESEGVFALPLLKGLLKLLLINKKLNNDNR